MIYNTEYQLRYFISMILLTIINSFYIIHCVYICNKGEGWVYFTNVTLFGRGIGLQK